MAATSFTDSSLATSSPNLKVSDVMCPICLCILVEPVTMPCSHSLCMPCFSQHVSKTSLACPLCRLRISVWVRRAAKTKRLVNTRLWQTIKAKFPAKVEARLQGEEDSDSEVLFTPVHHVSKPGEIRQEFEAMVAMEQEEDTRRRTQENVASEKLIKKFQDEDGMQLRVQQEQLDLTKNDDVVAQQIKDAEMMQLQNEMKRLQMMCASDEAVARQIEETESKLKQRQRLLSRSEKKKAVTPKGPMDVYIGQKTPRTCGKVPVPETSSQPTVSRKCLCKGKNKLETVRKNAEGRTSTFSRSKKTNPNLSQCDVPHSSTSVQASTGLGRQLREITSSQSSEEDLEESSSSRHSMYLPNTSGKENRSKSRKVQPKKIESVNGKMSYRTKNNNLQFSPDIDSYSGGKKVNKCLLNMDEVDDDSDGTDAEEENITTKKYKHKAKENDNESANIGRCRSSYNKFQGSQNHQSTSSDKKGGVLVNSIQDETSGHDEDSPDFGTLLSEEGNAESLAFLVDEQKRLEEILKQEVEDRLLAEALQTEFNNQQHQINRSKGSEDEYALRDRRHHHNSSLHVAGPSGVRRSGSRSTSTSFSPKGTKRQTTLTESIAKHRKIV